MIEDREQEIIDELRAIRANLGDEMVDSDEIETVEVLENIKDTVFLQETADLEESNENGSIHIGAGEIESLVEYKPATSERLSLKSVGASNIDGAQYRLIVGNRTVIDWHNAPLGTYQDGFSFHDKLNSTLKIDRTVKYEIRNSTNSEIEAVGRAIFQFI